MTTTAQTITELDQFYIIGVSVRTSNQNNQSQKDIGELWGRFLTHNLIENIPNKETSDVYCVYTDYESDHTGPYTTIIGCRVSSIDEIPADFVAITVPKSKYDVYQSEGKLPDCVAETWHTIWAAGRANRKYAADFDVYGANSRNPEQAEVDTYVSVR